MSGGHLKPAQAGSPRTCCSGPCQDGFWRFQRTETPQTIWATCSHPQSSPQWKKFFL